MIVKKILLLTCILLMTAHLTKAQNSEIVTNKTIISLVKADLDSSIIESKIETSTCKFDLSTNGLVALKKSGVPPGIIKAMMQKQANKPPLPEKSIPIVNSHKKLDILNYVYASFNDTVRPLEKALANMKTKSKMLGYGGVSNILEIDGASSSVRISQNSSSGFLINTGGEASPELILYKLKVSKNKRQATMAKAGLGGLKGSEGGLLINVSKIQDGIYKLSPSASLEKGEYFFLNRNISNAGMNSEVYAFGID